jgi:hypothetical protein
MPYAARMAKANDAASARVLTELPNVGPATVGDFRALGIHAPEDLRGRDPFELYRRLCALTGVRHDPCVIDVFISAVRFMEGAPARPWWHYTSERKAVLAVDPSLARLAFDD